MLGYARILNTTRGDLYENPLKVGELVQLRSGGPVMTVASLEDGETSLLETGKVAVIWHDRNGVVNEQQFAPQLLRRARRSFFARRR